MRHFKIDYAIFFLFSIIIFTACDKSGIEQIDTDTRLSATNEITSLLASNLKEDLLNVGIDEESAATIADTALALSNTEAAEQNASTQAFIAQEKRSLYQQVATQFIEGAMKGIAQTSLSTSEKQTAAGINAYTPLRSMAESATDLSETERKAAVEAICNQAVAKLQETGLASADLVAAIYNIGEKSVQGVGKSGVSAAESRELVQSATGGATKGLSGLSGISAVQAQSFSSDLAEGSVKGIANFEIEGVQTTDLLADVTTGLNEGLLTVESSIEGFDINTATAGVDSSIDETAQINLGLTATEINSAISNGKSQISGLYQITFNANSGQGTMNNLAIAEDTAANLTVNKFTRNGFNFIGWATTSNASTPIYSDGASFTMGSADVTLYAVWALPQYEITFDANGGTGIMGNLFITQSASANLTPNEYTKNGYAFVGWSTTSTATTAEYDDAENYTMGSAGVTLYAVWAISQYEITFDANGGTGIMGKQGFTAFQTANLVGNSFSKAEYAFLGWSTTSSATKPEYTDAASFTIDTSDVTLYAVWTKIYEITFNGNGSTSGIMSNQGFTANQTKSLPSNGFSRTGYHFLGWSTNAGATDAEYTDAENYTMGSADVTLYAVWAISQYEVTFDANSGTGTMNKQGFSAFQTANLASNGFSKAGYAFLGWAKTSNATDPEYTDAESFSIYAADVTLYAVWGEIYEITFDGNDSTSGTMSNQGFTANQTKSLSDNGFLRTGYHFLGWSTNAGATEAEYTDTENYTMDSADVTLYAVWGEIYEITFNGNGSTSGTMSNQGFTANQTKSLSRNGFSKTGYNFLGWATYRGATTADYNDAESYTMRSADRTLYAVWQSTHWSHQAYLKAPNAEAADYFGESVSVSGDTIIVGAWKESSSQTTISNSTAASDDNGASESGAAYVFVRSGTNWSHQAYLKAPNADSNDWFGRSVSISGDTIVVGAYGERSNQTTITNGLTASPNNSVYTAGAAYVFTRNDTAWTQQAYLKAPNADSYAYSGDRFGWSVSVSGDTIVVGATFEDSNQTTITNGTTASSNNHGLRSGAAYVFVRSGTTWSQQAYLKAPNAESSDHFGESVSVSGDTIVVGTTEEDSSQTTITNGTSVSSNNDAWYAGTAYVFVRSGTHWSHQAYLKAPNAEAYDYFGAAVAISGDTIVVGAYGEDSNQTTISVMPGGSDVNSNGINGNFGAAYVFVRSGTHWSHQAYLKAPYQLNGPNFGRSVSISGDTIVVGARHNGDTSHSGIAYIFSRSEATWTLQANITAPNSKDVRGFSNAVSVSGDTIVVGAKYEMSDKTDIINGTTVSSNDDAYAAGAAYVFIRSKSPDVTLYSVTYNANGSDNDEALPAAYVPNTRNNYVVPSASQLTKDGIHGTHWNTAADGSGISYMPGQSVTLMANLDLYVQYAQWIHQADLQAPNAEYQDYFGENVSVSGDTIVVGAWGEDSNQTTITNGTTASSNNGAQWAGAAYVFVRRGTTWSHQAYLKAPNASYVDYFGESVAISGDTIVVGAKYEGSGQTTITNGSTASSDNSTHHAGAAYVFVRSGTTWSTQAYLKAPNAGEGDLFGNSVSISENTIVVGAIYEDSSQSTITNGTTVSSDDSGDGTGAAYVFVRSGTIWTHQAFLKAPNPYYLDQFANSVSISGSTVVVGAWGEDSNQTTITNGATASSNNSASSSGAAYVFVRTGATWSNQAYLKAANAEAGDQFGEAVAVSGDTIVVGARYEASDQTTITNGTITSNDNRATKAGAAYVFVRSGENWSHQAYLKAPNAEAGDQFGEAVAVSADTIVVGAWLEDSNQTTITNGKTASSDNSASVSGAAYVFVRSGTTWVHQAYIKSPNSLLGNYFGNSVSVSGDTIVVGGHTEYGQKEAAHVFIRQ